MSFAADVKRTYSDLTDAGFCFLGRCAALAPATLRGRGEPFALTFALAFGGAGGSVARFGHSIGFGKGCASGSLGMEAR